MHSYIESTGIYRNSFQHEGSVNSTRKTLERDLFMFSKITHTYSASFQAQESFFSLLSMDGNGQTLKLSSSMQCWNTWNCYPLSTLLSNALPQANLHNWMVQIVWNNSQMLPSSLQCVTYSALQEKIKTIAKFKPQLKYKVSSGNTFHNISPIKSPGNI